VQGGRSDKSLRRGWISRSKGKCRAKGPKNYSKRKRGPRSEGLSPEDRGRRWGEDSVFTEVGKKKEAMKRKFRRRGTGRQRRLDFAERATLVQEKAPKGKHTEMEETQWTEGTSGIGNGNKEESIAGSRRVDVKKHNEGEERWEIWRKIGIGKLTLNKGP